MNWLIPANIKQYDFISAFDELKILDWTKRVNYNVGDIVYIYGSKPFQKIVYKTEVIGININYDETINDTKYWRIYDQKNKPSDNLYVRLKVLTKYNDDRFTLDILKLSGLKSAPQGPIKLKKELLLFVESMDLTYILSNGENGNEILSGTEKEILIKSRIGQGSFREQLITKESKCKICGVSNVNLLIASHIKPWALCNDFEKLDINNGLLLCPNHDALFDKGFISFSEKGRIIIAEEICNYERKLFNISDNITITLNKKESNYMSFHRENLFKRKY